MLKHKLIIFLENIIILLNIFIILKFLYILTQISNTGIIVFIINIINSFVYWFIIFIIFKLILFKLKKE